MVVKIQIKLWTWIIMNLARCQLSDTSHANKLLPAMLC